MEPRKQIYSFAHRILPLDVQREPNLWSIVTGDRAHSYAQTRWQDAADGGASLPATDLLWVAPVRDGNVEISLLRMPPPQAPTEPHFVAFVRVGSAPLRYFVLEQGSSQNVYWAEWRTNMRIRGADVPVWSTDGARVSALPLPYLAAFVDAILGETRAIPGAGVRAAAPAAAQPGSYDRPWMALLPIAAVGIALAIGMCNRGNPGAQSALAAAATKPDLDALRADARLALDEATRKLAGCEMPAKVSSIAELVAAKRQSIPVGDKARLKRAQVDKIFISLEHMKRVAATVGGFACVIDGLDTLQLLVADGSAQLREPTAKLRAATRAFSPPTIAVVPNSFCDLKDKKCKSALIWVDLATLEPIATLWATAPQKGGKADDELTRRLTAELLAQVAAW